MKGSAIVAYIRFITLHWFCTIVPQNSHAGRMHLGESLFMNTMHWKLWRNHFERNAARSFPALPMAPALSAVMVETLQKFQLGETGEGRVAKQIDHYHSPAIDDDYRASLKLFVKEEGRHARILAGILRSAGSEVLKGSASSSAFTAARGLMGVRFKLVVLLAAEVVASEAYPLLVNGARDEITKNLLKQLAGDEQHHMRFHQDFFANALRGVKRFIFPPLLLSIVLVAALLCAFEHRRAFNECGVGMGTVVWKMLCRAGEVLGEVFRSKLFAKPNDEGRGGVAFERVAGGSFAIPATSGAEPSR